MSHRRTIVIMLVAGAAAALTVGCARTTNNPDWATRSYPTSLHRPVTVDMQVFRRDTEIEIVNSTARSYQDFDLWVNQRYVRHVDSLPAGKSIRLSLWEFHDDLGDVFNAGGFFRTYDPTPVRLVEIQPKPDQLLIGLVTIRAEEINVKPDPTHQ